MSSDHGFKLYWVRRADMGGEFGYCEIGPKNIYVCEDLPQLVMKFVLLRELHQVRHSVPSDSWIKREWDALRYAARREPWGYVLCVLMSLSRDRLKYYWRRAIDGR